MAAGLLLAAASSAMPVLSWQRQCCVPAVALSTSLQSFCGAERTAALMSLTGRLQLPGLSCSGLLDCWCQRAALRSECSSPKTGQLNIAALPHGGTGTTNLLTNGTCVLTRARELELYPAASQDVSKSAALPRSLASGNEGVWVQKAISPAEMLISMGHDKNQNPMMVTMRRPLKPLRPSRTPAMKIAPTCRQFRLFVDDLPLEPLRTTAMQSSVTCREGSCLMQVETMSVVCPFEHWHSARAGFVGEHCELRLQQARQHV